MTLGLDFGTLITDAAGGMHDIAKGAFDSFSKTKARKPLDAGSSLLQTTFDDMYTGFREKMATDYHLTLEEAPDSFDQVAQEIQRGIAQHLKGAAIEAIGAGVIAKTIGGEAGGPIGILAMQVMSVAVDQFEQWYDSAQVYTPGQWLHLDNGEKTTARLINKPMERIEVSESHTIFGDVLNVPMEIDYEVAHSYSIGFALGHSEGTKYMVFNFLNGQEQEFEHEKIRLVNDELAKKLDKNEAFSIVREVRFMKDHDPTLESYVPTEPGETVWYEKRKYQIVKTEKKMYEIEDSDGNRYAVHVSQLTGGRTHSSVAWNKVKGEIMASGFLSVVPDAVFAGQWVWVPTTTAIRDAVSSSTKAGRRLKEDPLSAKKAPPIELEDTVLGVVVMLEAGVATVITAYDGLRTKVPMTRVHPVATDLQASLNKNSVTKIFKKRVLNGAPTTFLPLGRTKPELALGIGYERDTTQKVPPPTEGAVFGEETLGQEKTALAQARAERLDRVHAGEFDGLLEMGSYYPPAGDFGGDGSGGGGSAGFLVLAAVAAIVIMGYT